MPRTSSADLLHEPTAEELGRRPSAQPARAGGTPALARSGAQGARHSVTSEHMRQTQDSLLFPSAQTRTSSSGSHRAALASRDSLTEMNTASSLRSSYPLPGLDGTSEPIPQPSRHATPPSIDTHALQNALVRQQILKPDTTKIIICTCSPYILVSRKNYELYY